MCYIFREFNFTFNDLNFKLSWKMPNWIYFPADYETLKKRPSCYLSCNEVKNWKYIHILSYFSWAWPLFAKKLLNSNNNIYKIFFSKLLCSAYSGQICMELFFWFLLFEEFMYKKIQFKVVLTYICVILLLENRPWINLWWKLVLLLYLDKLRWVYIGMASIAVYNLTVAAYETVLCVNFCLIFGHFYDNKHNNLCLNDRHWFLKLFNITYNKGITNVVDYTRKMCF